ncbi:MAG: metallopeptidase [Ruminococcus sp.]|nr:metallopeptidase [Ruminococcus sp.]
MNDNAEREKRAAELAKDIITTARNRLVVNLRFLDTAMGMLNHVPYNGTFATDGKNIGYDKYHTLKTYKQSKELITRGYLHMVLHCVFRHFFVTTLIDQPLWDLACDIAVEGIITELDLKITEHPRQNEMNSAMNALRKNVNMLTAEKIYHYLLSGNVSGAVISLWLELFAFDDHSIWYMCEVTLESADGDGDGNNDDDKVSFGVSSAIAEIWKDISEQLQVDLETFSKDRGDTAGSLIQNLTAVNRERYDYSLFLKKFAVMGEAMKVNDDEFDYIFYTYGLQLYKKMPLIEPLEYKEVKRIKEFVIVIDTSGSVAGELVQKFINKTYNILKQSESFFTKINLHIIQCDAEIQEDVKITSQEEFDEYLKNMTLKGFGGTDFRPAFEYVDKLIQNKEFTNLKGLIYFTDGCGVFPARQPDYNTAFVYIDDEYNNPDVPVWAIKLVLQSNEI